MSTFTRAQQQQLERTLRLVLNIHDQVLELPKQTRVAHQRIADLEADGLPQGSDGPRGTGVSNPTLNAAIANQTPRQMRDEIDDHLRRARHELAAAIDTAIRHQRHGDEPPHRIAAGQGECLIDGEWVPGVGENRIKAGLCPRHYRAWLRWKEANEAGEHAMFVLWSQRHDNQETPA